MSNATGQKFSQVYPSALWVDNATTGLDGTLRAVKDWQGNASPLQISTSYVNITALKYNGNIISIAGALTLSGAFATTVTVTGTTTVTLPTTGTLATLAGSETFTNKTLTTPTITNPTVSTGTFTSPTLVTPALGTPASGVATNLTGLPISTGVSGLGSGIATWLATPSSANLYSALTTKTGSGGSAVFATSPTITTPTIILIQGSNGNNAVGFADAASVADYLSITSGTNNSASLSVTSTQTNAAFSITAKGTGGVVIGSAGLATVPVALAYNGFKTNLTVSNTADRTVTFPDANVTLATQAASILSFSAGTGGNLTAGNTYYIGVSSGSTTADQQRLYIPFACTIKNMYVQTITAPGATHTQTWTLYKNNSSTVITATVSGTANNANDTSHSITCAAGDYLEMQIVMGASATTTAYVQATLQVVAT